MGGPGEMGSRAAEDLASSPDVQPLTLADRDLAAARAWADKLKAGGTNVDARIHSQLVSARRGYGVAASALGPFYEFEARLVWAAIEARVDYASICDEFDAAQAVFSEFAQKAKDSGRIILTGLGASPRMTNVAAALLSRQMDTVNRVDISCYQPLDPGGGEAVVRHMLHIRTGKVPVFRDGQHMPIDALAENCDVEFPRYGKIRLWDMGNSEPITIPRFIPGIKAVNFHHFLEQGERRLGCKSE
jgi:lysine 6-dehydrogenase